MEISAVQHHAVAEGLTSLDERGDAVNTGFLIFSENRR